MELKKYTVNGNEYMFICNSWETSRAWGHEVHLFKNNVEISKNRIRYYNRTWECFQYQSCMLGAISNRQDELVEWAIEDYKYEKNISRFRKGEREIVVEKAKNESENYKDLVELYEMVSNRRYN